MANAANYRLFYALEDVEQTFTGPDGEPFTGPDGQSFTSVIPAGTYHAAPADSLDEIGNPSFAVIRLVTTANADGSYPAAPTPPPGDGGGGYGGGGGYQQEQVQA